MRVRTSALYLLMACSWMLSCRTSSRSSQIKDATFFLDPTKVPPVSCNAGSDAYYLLMVKSEGELPEAKDLDLPVDAAATKVVGPSERSNLRLDLCVTGDNVELKKAVMILGGEYLLVELVPNSKVLGLKELFFEQDYSLLDIELPYIKTKIDGMDAFTSDSSESLLIKGHSKFKSAYYTTIAREEAGGPLSNPIVLGVYEVSESDGISNNPCAKVGGSPVSGEFTLGTASFKWEACPVGGTSGGASPLLHSISVADTSTNLPADIRGSEFKVNPDAFKHKRTHHSVCESLVISLPHAVYGLTSDGNGFGGGDCPAPLAGAPTRKVGDKGLAYIFSYSIGTKKRQTKGIEAGLCHFTRACPGS